MAEDSTKLKFRIFLGLVSLSVKSDCPVLHEEKISGNRVGFCQLDFRGSCFNRNCRWIPSGGFSMRIHLEKSTNGNQEKKKERSPKKIQNFNFVESSAINMFPIMFFIFL